MIKLIIFDLDGVLCDTREWHYDALNAALAKVDVKYVISREEHLSSYDGLPTSKKLKQLTEKKQLPPELYNEIWRLKQEATIDIIKNGLSKNDEAFKIMSYLKDNGYKVAVASNSIRDTVRVALDKMGLLGIIDYYYSNEDVRKPKPSTEMYLKAMLEAGADPKETIIIEDSHVGRKAVMASGAYLYALRNPLELKMNKLVSFIEMMNDVSKAKPKWHGGKMNIVIPMAGAGSRFAKVGYTFPKPLIDVRGKPMIQVVIENLNIEAQYTFLVQREHYEKYHLRTLLNLLAPGCNIIQLDGVTEGAACTVLLAKDIINNDEPLFIVNSDQYVEWESNEFMYSATSDSTDGCIVTFTSTHPKWSFVELDEHGFVSRTAEKEPISDIATTGHYFWNKGSDFVKYAEQMIARDIRVNNEFYVCPVYNQAIEDGKKIKTYRVQKMMSLGTPEDLEQFLTEYKELPQ